MLELDVDGRKLNLGHKQTQENPWDKHEETFTVGSIHEGTVKEKIDKGIIVSFAGGVMDLLLVVTWKKKMALNFLRVRQRSLK